jgi:hypothetical protein
MKIKGPDLPYVERDQLLDDLNVLLNFENTPMRPCRECKQACSCSGSVHCTCDCHEQCSHARKRLSIDGELYPIEHKIVEMVYVMNSLQGIESCWSCEGHLDPDNKLWKVPQVWFYSMARVYLELISDHLDSLGKRGLTKYTWCIDTVDVGTTDYTTYRLYPDLDSNHETQLVELQEDIKAIAQHMKNNVLSLARDWSRQSQVA